MEPSSRDSWQHGIRMPGGLSLAEVAEQLDLQRVPAAVAAGVVLLLSLATTLLAPGLLPANVLTGLVVGIAAVAAAVAAAVVLDGRDPVLRGPRHLRRDGHEVLARMAGDDSIAHGGVVLTALLQRLEGRSHVSVALAGGSSGGADPSALAVAVGRGAAAEGQTALVIDLRSGETPGIDAVGSGAVRLGEVARLADDRPYAWIGAGKDKAAAARAAAAVARRPPRDLKLLLVVAPEAATHVPEVLAACERTVLLVAADTQQRAMVTARMDALRRAGGAPEVVVVGGGHAFAELPATTRSAAPQTSREEPSPSPSPSPSLSTPVRTTDPSPQVDEDVAPVEAVVIESGPTVAQPQDVDVVPAEPREAVAQPAVASSPVSRPQAPDVVDVTGMEDADPLQTAAVLERLVAEHLGRSTSG